MRLTYMPFKDKSSDAVNCHTTRLLGVNAVSEISHSVNEISHSVNERDSHLDVWNNTQTIKQSPEDTKNNRSD